jgi:hypothetical protein
MITTRDKIAMLDTHRENAAHDLLGRPSHRLTERIEALEILLCDRQHMVMVKHYLMPHMIRSIVVS